LRIPPENLHYHTAGGNGSDNSRACLNSHPAKHSRRTLGKMGLTHRLFGPNTMFTLSQTNLKAGLKGHIGRLGRQVYVGEDILTWEGVDILFHIGVTWNFQAPS